MFDTSEKCKNCGGEYGIHNGTTNQCPFGGVEAPIDKEQVWMESRFEPGITYNELISQRDGLLRVCKYVLEQSQNKQSPWKLSGDAEYELECVIKKAESEQ